VEIDAESIRRFGQWPWPRDLLADLLTASRGASAIGIDVLMPDADRLSPDNLVRRDRIEVPAVRDALLALPQSDAVLAAALHAQPTVLAMTVDDRADDRASKQKRVQPVREQGDFTGVRLPHASGATCRRGWCRFGFRGNVWRA
jgi:CHASE2 domain-containing sensor protein